MLNVKRALRSDRLMKALTGLSVTEFKSLLPTFSAALQKSKKQKQPQRQRALGGGRKHTLLTAQDKFFFILFYLKCYPTFDLAGFFFGVDRSQTNRWVQELLPILETSLGWQAVLPQRKISSLEQFVQQFPELKDVFIDGTERPIQRPSRAKAQRQHYSGKKKKHTLTNLVLAAEDRSILWLSPTKPGARQDYYRFKQTQLGYAIPEDVAVWVDLGLMGISKDYPVLDVVIPHKSSKHHPLTASQKAENRVISSFRILVEHALAGIKRFRCLTELYRNKGRALADQFMLLACGLWNYHLRQA
jgi:hypothetical protein